MLYIYLFFICFNYILVSSPILLQVNHVKLPKRLIGLVQAKRDVWPQFREDETSARDKQFQHKGNQPFYGIFLRKCSEAYSQPAVYFVYLFQAYPTNIINVNIWMYI